MILDYNYGKYSKQMEVSYINSEGKKSIISFNINRFKTYNYSDTGEFDTWDGKRCTVKYTDKPSTFDIKTYFKEMPEKYRTLISGRTFPKLYTFDIETEISDDFPDVNIANLPITVISIVSPEFDCVVLGTRHMEPDEIKLVDDNFHSYLDNTQFYKSLNIEHEATFKYLEFPTEEQMLEFFLTRFVARVPVIAGWNSILFDWQYIVNRIKNFFPNLSIKDSSTTKDIHYRRFDDKAGNFVSLPMPDHTLILDMMDVIDKEDQKVLPIKDSLSLDYIAHESMGINKIEYTGTLQDLFNADYPKYVYYNAIDSILVQLIDHKFKCMDHIYLFGLYCTEKLERCFSKIATTEALVFDNFYNRGLKIVPVQHDDVDRGKLMGAYVRIPTAGVHSFVCCNDFASLYPSTIRTCNLSFENFVGAFYDEERIRPYRKVGYIIIGPNVFKDEGTPSKPKIGEQVGTFINESALAKYRNNPDYFVSVNGCVYKNDKDYTFRQIQANLNAERDKSKYMSKRLAAAPLSDIEHVIKGKRIKSRTYEDDMSEELAKIGYPGIHSTDDLYKLANKEKFEDELNDHVIYLGGYEQSMKLLMNSMYGGCSHVAFYWYNMDLANDITGESRNLIHMMEDHIPDFWSKKWVGMSKLHEKLGITLKESFKSNTLNTSLPMVNVVYGDTDSLYISYKPLLDTIEGIEDMTLEQKRDILVDLNINFMDRHNEQYIKEYYDTRYGKSVHNFELETINKSGVWMDNKKKYAQILIWKDGETYDVDNLPLKIKGLEAVKSSYPKFSRTLLKEMYRYLLETCDEKYLLQRLNKKMMEMKQRFMEADIELISAAVKANNYTKFVLDDKGEVLRVAPKTHFSVRGLGYYNWLRNKYRLPGNPVYGGKVKYYIVKGNNKNNVQYFAYVSGSYPKWAPQYAPVDRASMFQLTVLDPFNRILEANRIQPILLSGELQLTMF